MAVEEVGVNYIDEVFGPDGVLTKEFEGYVPRPGQIRLARAVERSMHTSKHVLAEGPCGTGKSLAYCVPAVQHAMPDSAIVIVTANISLQEQLVGKDLPMLARIFPKKLTFALLKGRNNYLCLDRLVDFDSGDIDDALVRQATDCLNWADETRTGDKSELSFVPDAKLWERLSVGSDDCRRDDCEYRKDCYANRAKEIASEANIIVTNYHMLFAHIMVKQQSGMDLVLPPFHALILDEAHEAVDIAREFFGFSMSEYSFRNTVSAMRKFGVNCGRLESEARKVFLEVSQKVPRSTDPVRLRVPEYADWTDLRAELQAVISVASGRKGAGVAVKKAQKLEDRLVEAMTLSDDNKVYWAERAPAGWVKIKARPLEMGGILHNEVFGIGTDGEDAVRTLPVPVTVTSATLTTSGTFDFISEQMGVPYEAMRVIADTPFNFERQAMLVTPDMPDPNSVEFLPAMITRVQEVIEQCGGRTLCLFTSYEKLEATYAAVAPGSTHAIFKQGDLPRTELVRRFKEDTNSVLFGTSSFWTGVDVSGEALTGLVIDRLPFSSPNDPITQAIADKLGNQAFYKHSIPTSIITLRQGVGRLIRSKSDYGVVVILDNRLVKKGYGQRFIKSLPKMTRTSRVEDIGPFLAKHRR